MNLNLNPYDRIGRHAAPSRKNRNAMRQAQADTERKASSISSVPSQNTQGTLGSDLHRMAAPSRGRSTQDRVRGVRNATSSIASAPESSRLARGSNDWREATQFVEPAAHTKRAAEHTPAPGDLSFLAQTKASSVSQPDRKDVLSDPDTFFQQSRKERDEKQNASKKKKQKKSWFEHLKSLRAVSSEEELEAEASSKKRRFPSRLLLAWAIFIIAIICIYPFTKDFQIRALKVTGNYYYSAAQIYSIADVKVNSLMLFNSPSTIQQKLEENPLIEQAEVIKDGQDLSIHVDEKMIIGYYSQDGTNYLVTADDERIPVENDIDLRTLVHYPLLVNLSDETISQICEQVHKYPEELTREVFERIAEIQPWSESYNKNMLKLVLQDGNTVFTEIPSLFMMSTYSRILENLQGSEVCLMLDGANHVVNKVACSYMYLSPEERAVNREIPKKVVDPDYEEEETGSEDEAQDEQAGDQQPADTQPAQEDPSAGIPSLYSGFQTIQTANGPIQIDVSAITDWEPAAVENFQHSPSTNLFRAMDTGIVYTYEEATDTFYPI